VEDLGMSRTFWSGKRVLVTGTTGLVGSWLTERLLAHGASVVGLIRDQDPQSRLFSSNTIQRISVVSGELEDYAAVDRAINEHEVDTVFHLGAQTLVGAARRSPRATFDANIRGTYHLLDACRVHSGLVKRVIVASSDKAYGDVETLPYTEAMPPLGRHPYDVSKSCADLLAQAYAVSYGLPVAVARCGNIYGGGDLNWSRIVPGTIRSLLRGERPVLRSDGRSKRDYVYVEDAVDAYLQLGEQMHRSQVRGRAFNFGPSRPLTVLDIVSRLRTLMHTPRLTPVIRNTARGEIRHQYLSSKLAGKVLAWKPSVTLDDGLKRTIAWYERYFADHA
jgi:CDP-glucose 4,6-dehydratase